VKKILIIAGPTAVGKSAAAVRAAQKLNGEIISADSMQIYKGMDIGTAKIKPSEMGGIKHYLVDELWPDETYNAAVFKERAKGLIEDIASRGKLPIICGGTGFYINALLYDVDFDGHSGSDPVYRETLQHLLRDEGNNRLYQMLEEVDSKAALEIGPGNAKRLIRALEYYNATGRLMSEHNARQRAKKPAYDARILILSGDRQWIYNRINQRVDDMMEQGLLGEVEGLLAKGYHAELTSMQALGYKEVIRHLKGECSLSDAINAIKQGTRRFAKRQITWFKHQLPQARWIDVQKQEEIS
jgi:tRNA dimethylallyltransferase